MSDRIYLLQANPGKIAKTFIVPESIRSLSPLEARHHYDFPALFKIYGRSWNDLDNIKQLHEQFRKKERRRAWIARSLQLLLLILFFALWEIASKRMDRSFTL